MAVPVVPQGRSSCQSMSRVRTPWVAIPQGPRTTPRLARPSRRRQGSFVLESGAAPATGTRSPRGGGWRATFSVRTSHPCRRGAPSRPPAPAWGRHRRRRPHGPGARAQTCAAGRGRAATGGRRRGASRRRSRGFAGRPKTSPSPAASLRGACCRAPSPASRVMTANRPSRPYGCRSGAQQAAKAPSSGSAAPSRRCSRHSRGRALVRNARRPRGPRPGPGPWPFAPPPRRPRHTPWPSMAHVRSTPSGVRTRWRRPSARPLAPTRWRPGVRSRWGSIPGTVAAGMGARASSPTRRGGPGRVGSSPRWPRRIGHTQPPSPVSTTRGKAPRRPWVRRGADTWAHGSGPRRVRKHRLPRSPKVKYPRGCRRHRRNSQAGVHVSPPVRGQSPGVSSRAHLCPFLRPRVRPDSAWPSTSQSGFLLGRSTASLRVVGAGRPREGIDCEEF